MVDPVMTPGDRRARTKAVRRAVLVAVVAVVALASGGAWLLLATLLAVAWWAIWFDDSRRNRGGWKRIPPPSLAVTQDADPTFLINHRSDAMVDPSGRTFSAVTDEPTQEKRVSVRRWFWDGPGGTAVELVLFVGVVAGLLWASSH